ncbi:MAG TPA: ABC transporter substrate-binding protein [Blastocatellia bacterium]|nr:ABC transporter substrate-binding protein [Blastocatellia bacterium]
MLFALKRLSLGLLLIALASAALLVSDLNRRTSSNKRIPHIAFLQHASQPLLDDTIRGMIDALAAEGFVDGKTISIRRYNAENDVATDNNIAKEITGGQYDMVLTSSTLSMQAVANANKSGKAVHVFGAVADPYIAGVGLKRENPLDHPKYFVGIGTFMPVEGSFELARKMYPGLKTVGVVWNVAEANSRAYVTKAREVCSAMGITLIEANADSSSAVFEAASSVVSRGAEALWIGGDVTVMVAVESVLTAARKGKIPVFTLTPPTAKRGGLFDLGANFYEVGKQSGALAADILKGSDSSKIPIRNVVPQQLLVNKTALTGLKDLWRIPDDVLANADVVIDENGVHEKAAAPKTTAADSKPLSKKWQLSMAMYIETPTAEEAEKGLRDGFVAAGLVENRDYEIKKRSAQGDIATMNGIMDATLTDGSDMLLSLSTPSLQTAIQKIHSIPIVFTLVGEPLSLGAGKSNQDHLPNLTGTSVVSPFDEMMTVIRQTLPSAHRIGTIFAPAEVNSVYYKGLLIAAAQKAGLEVEAVPANSSSDVADSALALMNRKIDAVCQISDNLSGATFTSISQAAKRAKLPVFAFSSPQSRLGASVVVARDFYDAGKEAALMAARIMRGESPASMPIQPTQKTKITINRDEARNCGLQIPPDLIKRADEVIGN